ncbi:MAG: hypothetical protein AAGI91_01505, partial [Bacteroidota bacterium]
VGVVLHARTAGFLAARLRRDAGWLAARCPSLDAGLLARYLAAYEQVAPRCGVLWVWWLLK